MGEDGFVIGLSLQVRIKERLERDKLSCLTPLGIGPIGSTNDFFGKAYYLTNWFIIPIIRII